MTDIRPLTIAMVAGETSGDALGAGLIRVLKTRSSNIRFVGVAGPLMQSEGCEAWYDMGELETMGIVEVFSKLNRLLRIRFDLARRLTDLQPDVFIGIDAPDFNLTLENNLKKNGIKTVHYVSPSIWAWRRRRIFKIRRSTDLVLLLFPFEKEIYEKFNVTYRFVGHRIADIMPLNPDKKAARNTLGISQYANCLALLPGSRETEIEMLSANFIKTAQILRQHYPDLEVIVPLVNTKCRKKFEHIKSNTVPNFHMRLLDGKSREVLIASDIALLASGTATLECMLAKCPMVVGYRMKPITYWLVKRLLKSSYISLPNLISGRELVEEILQENCHPRTLSKALFSLLEDKKRSQEIYKIFLELHQEICCNADEQAADAILDLSNKN